jgi:hypothetical protein
LYAPVDDPVFELVPETFGQFADTLYKSMGSPVISWKNIWDIYKELLFRFEHLDEATDCIKAWEVQVSLMDSDEDSGCPLIAGQSDLLGGMDEEDEEDGSYYMGGVNNGRGLGEQEFTASNLSTLIRSIT